MSEVYFIYLYLYASCKVKISVQEGEIISVPIYGDKSEVPWGIQTLIPLWFLSPPTSPGVLPSNAHSSLYVETLTLKQNHTAQYRVLQNSCTYRWDGILCVQSSYPSCPWDRTPNSGLSTCACKHLLAPPDLRHKSLYSCSSPKLNSRVPWAHPNTSIKLFLGNPSL